MDEILDIVDEQNSVIGKAPREEIHRKGLQHRSSHIFIFNSEGRLYLQKRAYSKKEHPGYYDSSAAGHVEEGESYFVCAIRELEEELGIDETALTPVETQKVPDGLCVEHARLFLSCPDKKPHPDPREVESGCFVTMREVDEWIREKEKSFTPAFLIFLNRFRQDIQDWKKMKGLP